jgi:hypothetical protein
MRTLVLLLLGTVVLAGCGPTYHRHSPGSATVVIVDDDHYGPPPHAPAHGYRYQHRDGCTLRYDSRLRLYVVLGHRDYYFSDGVYFRYSSGGLWEFAASLGGKWSPASDSKVPKALHKQKRGTGKGRRW